MNKRNVDFYGFKNSILILKSQLFDVLVQNAFLELILDILN